MVPVTIRYPRLKLLASAVGWGLVLFFPCTAVSTQWNAFETKYFSVMYQDTEDLEKLNKKISFSDKLIACPVFTRVSSGKEYQKELKEKMDTLFEKIQYILDMQTAMKKVVVIVHTDEQALHQSYFNITRKNEPLRAWYVLKHNAIYVNIQDMFTNIIAHEIAHAIVGNSKSGPFSRDASEQLARYVDKQICGGVN